MLRILVSTFLLSGLASQALAAELSVITHDSFSVDKKLLAQFEAAHNTKVRLIKGGDTGAMVNKLILTKEAPIADVVYGIDNTLLGKARAAGILEPYKSPQAKNVPARLTLTSDGLLNTVDYGYVALNYDKAYFEKTSWPCRKASMTSRSPSTRACWPCRILPRRALVWPFCLPRSSTSVPKKPGPGGRP